MGQQLEIGTSLVVKCLTIWTVRDLKKHIIGLENWNLEPHQLLLSCDGSSWHDDSNLCHCRPLTGQKIDVYLAETQCPLLGWVEKRAQMPFKVDEDKSKRQRTEARETKTLVD